MKCNQDENHICDNIDMRKCKNCLGPMLCFCTRPEIRVMVNDLWNETYEEEQGKKKIK